VKKDNQFKVQRSITTNNARVSKKDWQGQIITTEPLKFTWLEDDWVATMGEYLPMEVRRGEGLG